MIRYRVRYYDCNDEKYVVRMGWCAGTNFQEAAAVIERYYGNDSDEVTFKIFENYEDELIEDGYLASLSAEDIGD